MQAPEDFFSSAIVGDISGVKQHLDDGVHADSQDDKYGMTALMWASGAYQKAVCELLITRGCNLDMQDKDGDTALIWASKTGKIPVVISLI